jgi:hypothetical protein
MNRKNWIVSIFALIPAVLIVLQIFWQPFHPPATRLKGPSRFVPPLELLFRYFDFNQKNALNEWKDKLFQGRVAYTLDFEGANGFVHSKSAKTASAVFYRIKYNLPDQPYLYWKWRVGKFPLKQKVADAKKRDDFAARVYVILASTFFTNFKCIEYVWDESLSKDTVLVSPYSDKIKQIVLETGREKMNEWTPEKRNVYEDYVKLFGGKPKNKVAAIALMTDSEGTESEAEGFFDDIQIGKD